MHVFLSYATPVGVAIAVLFSAGMAVWAESHQCSPNRVVRMVPAALFAVLALLQVVDGDYVGAVSWLVASVVVGVFQEVGLSRVERRRRARHGEPGVK